MAAILCYIFTCNNFLYSKDAYPFDFTYLSLFAYDFLQNKWSFAIQAKRPPKALKIASIQNSRL